MGLQRQRLFTVTACPFRGLTAISLPILKSSYDPKSIPIGSEVKNKEELNTIRIVTEYDNFVYSIPVLGGTPTVSGVSHTLAKAGELIHIYGTNLRGIDKITFPGDIVVEAGYVAEVPIIQ